MGEKQERFNINDIEYDKDGIPILPRIGFSIPKEWCTQFFEGMIREVRSTPGDYLLAIFTRYMRMEKEEIKAKQSNSQPGVEQRRTPFYGQMPPKPLQSKDDQEHRQISE